jgi:hypothetical protein
MRRVRALLACAALSACAGSTPGAKQAELPRGPVSLRIELLDGSTLTLGSLRGNVVLVTIISTADLHALVEVPRIKKLAKEYQGASFKAVAIALDDEPEAIRVFRDTFELTYPVGTVEDRAALIGPRGPFGKIEGVPTSILLDKEGRIAARMSGVWGAGVLEEAVRRLLAR